MAWTDEILAAVPESKPQIYPEFEVFPTTIEDFWLTRRAGEDHSFNPKVLVIHKTCGGTILYHDHPTDKPLSHFSCCCPGKILLGDLQKKVLASAAPSDLLETRFFDGRDCSKSSERLILVEENGKAYHRVVISTAAEVREDRRRQLYEYRAKYGRP